MVFWPSAMSKADKGGSAVWYILLNLVFAVWVFSDAQSRRTPTGAWAISTFLFGPIVLPLYLARRPLKDGEVRAGGPWWNVLKNFAILWTLVMAVAAVWGMVAVGRQASTLQSDVEAAGTGLGAVFGLSLIALLWFFPFVGAVALGLLLRQPSVVERGPTGPLAPSVPPPTTETQGVDETLGTAQRGGDRIWVWSDPTATVPQRSPAIVYALVALGVIAVLGVLVSSRGPQRGATPTAGRGQPGLEVVDFDWGRGQYGNTVLIGTVRNNTKKTYSYVQVEFNLYDENDVQVGSTLANVNNLEPGGTWRFEAIVLEGSARKARLKGVTGF